MHRRSGRPQVRAICYCCCFLLAVASHLVISSRLRLRRHLHSAAAAAAALPRGECVCSRCVAHLAHVAVAGLRPLLPRRVLPRCPSTHRSSSQLLAAIANRWDKSTVQKFVHCTKSYSECKMQLL
jgi:hypothetical protein